MTYARPTFDTGGQESLNRFLTMYDAAHQILEDHNNSADPYGFTLNLTKRSDIVTELNFVEYYGLGALESSDKTFDTIGPFTEIRQEPVREYAKELKSNESFIG
jgi:hypothetical protein